jgi:MazG family protein
MWFDPGQVKEAAPPVDRNATLDDLVAIMDRLRDPGGCPWDREQTYRTLRGYLLEECYEAVEAIDLEDASALAEELGDLLFQIVFLSRLAKEDGTFTCADVVGGIAAKIVRRHPHVFGDESAETSEEVLRHWEAVKKQEKAAKDPDAGSASVLSGIPRALPALQKAQRLGTKAARVGFDWERVQDLFAKLDEEAVELRQAVDEQDAEGVRQELGDLLFTIAMLARRLEVDPEEALEGTNRKFVSRFRRMEEELRRRGVPIEEAGSPLLDRLWNEAKG